MNGISGSSSCSFANMQQMQGMRQGKGAEGRFNKLDADKNGGLDQDEIQTMADKMSGMTGQTVNVEEVTKTYDANNDGLMDKGEMESMMRGIQDKMVGSLQGGVASQQSFASYLSNAENDSATTLMDMFGEQEEDQEKYSPVNIQV